MKILCKAIFLAVAVCAALCEGRASRPLWDDFANPLDSAKPWCYNWYNRLVGDCFLEPANRVTRSNLRYWHHSRKWESEPLPDSADVRIYRRMRCSGPSADDPLQSSGILGPVVFECSQDNHRKPHPKGKMQ